MLSQAKKLLSFLDIAAMDHFISIEMAHIRLWMANIASGKK